MDHDHEEATKLVDDDVGGSAAASACATPLKPLDDHTLHVIMQASSQRAPSDTPGAGKGKAKAKKRTRTERRRALVRLCVSERESPAHMAPLVNAWTTHPGVVLHGCVVRNADSVKLMKAIRTIRRKTNISRVPAEEWKELHTLLPLLPTPVWASKLFLCSEEAFCDCASEADVQSTSTTSTTASTTPSCASESATVDTHVPSTPSRDTNASTQWCSHGVPLLRDGFHVLRAMQLLCAQVIDMSVLAKSERLRLEKEAKTVFGRMARHVREGRDALWTCASATNVQCLMQENFFHLVNAIRIFEFTILDCLKVDKLTQGNYVTPAFSQVPSAHLSSYGPCLSNLRASCEQVLTHATRNGLLKHADPELQRVQWRAVISPKGTQRGGDAPVLPHVAMRAFTVAAKAALRRHRRGCGAPDCGAREDTPSSFKSCSNCLWTRYCSAKCQKAAWSKHKLICNKAIPPDAFVTQRLIIGADGDDDDEVEAEST